MNSPILRNLFESKTNIIFGDEILTEINNRKVLTLPTLIKMLVEFSYKPEYDGKYKDESKNILDEIVNSNICFQLYTPLYQAKRPTSKIYSSYGETVSVDAPKWKTEACDSIIKRLMIKNDGLYQFLLSLLDSLGNTSQQCAFYVAKYICNPLDIGIDKEFYYRNLGKQLQRLIKVSSIDRILKAQRLNEELHSVYLKFCQSVALECVHLFEKVNKKYSMEFLLDPLLQDLFNITDPDFDVSDPEMMIVMSAETFLSVLQFQDSVLNTLLVSNSVLEVIQSFSTLILQVLDLEIQSDNVYRRTVIFILSRLLELQYSRHNDCLALIKAWAKIGSPHVASRRLHQRMYFRATLDRQQCELALHLSSLEQDEEPTLEMERQLRLIDILATLLLELPSSFRDDLVSKTCMQLLKERFMMRSKKVETTQILLPTDLNNAGELGQKEELKFSIYRNYLLVQLFDGISPDCLKQFAGDLLKFAKLVLEWYWSEEGKLKGEEAETREEHLVFALDIMRLVLKFIDIKKSDAEDVAAVYVGLMRLREHSNPETATRSTDLCVVLATRGHVNPLLLSSEDEEQGHSHEKEEVDGDVRVALAEAVDPEPAVAGHGLLQLARILDSKRQLSSDCHARLLVVSGLLLMHADPFVYVRAIRVLVALAAGFPHSVLPLLCARVRAGRVSALLRELDTAAIQHDQVEGWMNLSEALMQLLRRLGPVCFKYKHEVLNALLANLNDGEEMVRAGAISSLAEFCSMLEFGLGNSAFQVVTAVCEALRLDPSEIVRTACALWMRKAVLGPLDVPRPDLMAVYPVEVVRLMFRGLSQALGRPDQSDTLVDHLAAAYKALDDCMRAFAFPRLSVAEMAQRTRVRILEL